MNESVLFILGTSRKAGNTRKLVDCFNEDRNAPVIDLADYKIAPYDYTYQNSNDDFSLLIGKLLLCKTVVFATPVYWYAMSSQLKTFIDRFSDLLGPRKDLGREMRNKNTFLIATGSTELNLTPGMEEVIKRTSDYLGMHYRGAYYARITKDLVLDPLLLQGACEFVEQIKKNFA